MATPLTELRLLNNVDLDTSYNNTFSSALFTNLAGQLSFFSAKTVYSFTNLTFQRKEKTIKVKRAYDDIETTNYGMFKNGTSGKWYFFFITDYMYISENVTEIKIEIDVEQTYLFDVTIADCFVEREHVNVDTVGLHTVEENLNTGQLINQDTDLYTDGASITIVVVVTELLTGTLPRGNYDGVYSAFGYYLFDRSDYLDVNTLIDNYTTAGKIEAIINIYLCPSSIIPSYTSGDLLLRNVATLDTFTNTKPTSLDGYSPKNNKLLTYPYSVCVLNNSEGQENEYRYEYFSGSNVEFNIRGVIVGSPQQSAIPKNYNGSDNFGTPYENIEEMMSIKDYQQCGWNTDIYKSWLAQNAFSIPLQIASSGLALGVGVSTSNPIGIASASIGVASTIGGFLQKSIIPDQANGNPTSSTLLGYSNKSFRMYHKCLRNEYAIIIDNYFTKFGYKINVLKTPNITSRTRFNYLKTQSTIINGNIPKHSLTTMVLNREKGITFWHVDDIGDYATLNTII